MTPRWPRSSSRPTCGRWQAALEAVAAATNPAGTVPGNIDKMCPFQVRSKTLAPFSRSRSAGLESGGAPSRICWPGGSASRACRLPGIASLRSGVHGHGDGEARREGEDEVRPPGQARVRGQISATPDETAAPGRSRTAMERTTTVSSRARPGR